MKDEEAARILSLMETRQEQPRPKFSFERGDDVRVIDGPFGGFNGVVEDVNYDKGKLRCPCPSSADRLPWNWISSRSPRDNDCLQSAAHVPY